MLKAENAALIIIKYLNILLNIFLNKFESFIAGGFLQGLYVVAFVLLIDLYVLGYKKSAIYNLLHPTKSTWYDVVIYLFTITGFFEVLSVISTLGLGNLIPKLIKNSIAHFDLTLHFKNPIIHTFLYLVMVDFIDYWRHRFAHEWKWWWSAHQFHHSATEFNVITVARSHPVDLALRDIMMYFPVFILGMPIESFLVIKLLQSFQGKVQHSMVDWDWGILGKYVFISPVGHRIHHSLEEVHWDKNYGHVTPLWDRLFGTWYEGNVVNKKIGVKDNPHNKRGVLIDLCIVEFNVISGIRRAFLDKFRTPREINPQKETL